MSPAVHLSLSVCTAASSSVASSYIVVHLAESDLADSIWQDVRNGPVSDSALTTEEQQPELVQLMESLSRLAGSPIHHFDFL